MIRGNVDNLKFELSNLEKTIYMYSDSLTSHTLSKKEIAKRDSQMNELKSQKETLVSKVNSALAS